MRFAFVTGLGLLVLASCRGNGPAIDSGSGPRTVPVPHAPLPARTALFEADWRPVALGAEPAAFHDPGRDGNAPYWLAAGQWRVVSVRTPAYTGLVYQTSEEQPQPYLSFRTLKTLPLPNRYRIEATVQPVSSPHFKAPVGEISIIPYYRDPTHYLEVLVTNDHIGLWLADGAEPDTDRGWTGLHFLPVKSRVGQLQSVTIDIDLAANLIQVQAGAVTYDLKHEFLAAGRGHQVAVRSAGNTFNLIKLKVAPRSPLAP